MNEFNIITYETNLGLRSSYTKSVTQYALFYTDCEDYIYWVETPMNYAWSNQKPFSSF